MKLNRVLIVHKRLVMSRKKDVPNHTAWARRRKEHDRALTSIINTVRRRGIRYHVVDRSNIKKTEGYDLIITVGGDGTVLAAAHLAGSIPLLGVNSTPRTSVGFFCTATTRSFPKIFDAVVRKKIKPIRLPMLEIRIDNKPLPSRALNDLLFTSSLPADSVYYRLHVGKRSEFQRGSGVWITAGPGSTAGYRSAGGNPQPITSRIIRFLVREPCRLPHLRYRLLRGTIPRGRQLGITCEGNGAMLYVDGLALTRRVSPKQVLTVRIARQPLFMYLEKS